MINHHWLVSFEYCVMYTNFQTVRHTESNQRQFVAGFLTVDPRSTKQDTIWDWKRRAFENRTLGGAHHVRTPSWCVQITPITRLYGLWLIDHVWRAPPCRDRTFSVGFPMPQLDERIRTAQLVDWRICQVSTHFGDPKTMENHMETQAITKLTHSSLS